MALRSTVYKMQLQVADMDRHYYGDHALTIARHPSENDERMMVRVLAFALYADPELSFGQGLSTPDDADLWKKDLTGAVSLWIDVGLPDEKLVKKACSRADQVVVLTYGRTAEQWWQESAGTFQRMNNLSVLCIRPEISQALAGLAQRTVQLQCTIQDGSVWLGTTDQAVEVELIKRK